ncbi:MAG: FlgD immunoglobulin-like domain containing protein [Nocardioides sp.]
MKLFKAAAAVLVACTVSVVGFAVPAYAYSPITVDSPNGDEFESGAKVSVAGYNESDSWETIEVECNNSNQSPWADVAPGSFSVSVGSFTGPDTCWIRDSASWDLLATFTVASPATTVSDASVNNDAFYPVVRDGYRDKVVFRWRQNHDGRATIKVTNSDGRTVRTATPRAWQGRNDWTWDGKNGNGNRVAKGRYRIKVTVNSNTVSAAVTVKTEIVTKTFRKRREGNQASSFTTRGNCYASRDSYDQVASLDCWGGRYAKAKYRFVIPAKAFDVRGTVDLRQNALDICCQGRITKGWSRPSNRSVALWAQVTGWRATDVDYVRVVYKQKVRI